MDSTDYHSQDATDVYEESWPRNFSRRFPGTLQVHECRFPRTALPSFATTAEEGQGFEFRRTLSKSQDYDLG